MHRGNEDNPLFFSSSRYRYHTRGHSFNSVPMLQILLEHYGHTVTCLGLPGSSNKQQIENLDHYLKKSTYSPDVIVFLQTDPLRDLVNNDDFLEDNNPTPDQKMAQRLGIKEWSVEDFESKVEHLLESSYTHLFGILDKNIHLLMLGGCSTVLPGLVEKSAEITDFKNAHVVSENIICDIHYISTGENISKFHPCYLNRIESYIDETWNKDLVDHLYQLSFYTIVSDHSAMRNYTYPDSVHINASSMIVVAEMINQYLDKLDM